MHLKLITVSVTYLPTYLLWV